MLLQLLCFNLIYIVGIVNKRTWLTLTIFFFVKRGVVIETLIDSNSGELQLMKPFKTPIFDFHYPF